MMDPKEFVDLPLGVKIPVPRNSKPVFVRTKLGEKLHQRSSYFDLADPYGRLLGTEYNSLHDPYLQDYHSRKDNLERLRQLGYVTSNGKVTCTLKEFNEYRQYLTAHKQEAEKEYRREEERIRQHAEKSKDSAKPMEVIGNPCLLHPRKPGCPPPARSTKTNLVLEQHHRRAKAVLEQTVAGGAPQVGKAERERLGQAERAAPSQASLEASSQSARGSRGKYSERLELPSINLSKRQQQLCQTPSPSTAHVQRLSRAIARETISRIQQSHAQRAGDSRTTRHEIPDTGREAMAKATALASALAARTTASQLADTVVEQMCQPGPALPPKLKAVGRQAVKLPKLQLGKESCATKDTLPSVGPQFSRQPVPPASPKPTTERGWHRPVPRRFALGEPQQPV